MMFLFIYLATCLFPHKFSLGDIDCSRWNKDIMCKYEGKGYISSFKDFDQCLKSSALWNSTLISETGPINIQFSCLYNSLPQIVLDMSSLYNHNVKCGMIYILSMEESVNDGIMNTKYSHCEIKNQYCTCDGESLRAWSENILFASISYLGNLKISIPDNKLSFHRSLEDEQISLVHSSSILSGDMSSQEVVIHEGRDIGQVTHAILVILTFVAFIGNAMFVVYVFWLTR